MSCTSANSAAPPRLTAAVSAGLGAMAIDTASRITAAEEQSAVVRDISGNVAAIDSFASATATSAQGTTELTTSLENAMAAVTRELRQFKFENDEQLVLAKAQRPPELDRTLARLP